MHVPTRYDTVQWPFCEHIGTGPANTRKHVFKISRARQVPLLANLRPSLRTCCVSRSLAGFAKEPAIHGEIPSKLPNCTSRKLPKLPRMSSPSRDLILCQHFGHACINFDLLSPHIQHYGRRMKLSLRWETSANNRILGNFTNIAYTQREFIYRDYDRWKFK